MRSVQKSMSSPLPQLPQSLSSYTEDQMTELYPDYWAALAKQENNPKRKRPTRPNRSRLEDPFGQLPCELSPNAMSESWTTADLYKPHPMVVTYACQRGVEIRGISKENHRRLESQFEVLNEQIDRLGLTLPQSFEQLIRNPHLLNAFRVPCHWIELGESIVQCPIKPSRKLLLFLHEAQGCNYTYLSLDESGLHEVVRTTYPYCLDPEKHLDAYHTDRNVYAYCDSFEEFLCWSFDESIESDHQSLKRWLEWGDSYRDTGDLPIALLAYNVAQTFDPSSQLIASRIDTVKKIQPDG